MGDNVERPMRCRGIRGATVATENSREAILVATRELLTLLVERNALETEEIASIFFTVTQDLNAEHPALAARELGWTLVPLLCAQEIPVPGGLGRCIRVLLHANTTRSQAEIQHIYLREAMRLRPNWGYEPAAAVAEPTTAEHDKTSAKKPRV
jgi:chorismate mutase